MDKIRQLQDMINESNRIVFFGGAGVSTESNIPDFRSADGLYKQKYRYSPEQIVSHSFFMPEAKMYWSFMEVSTAITACVAKSSTVHVL